MTRPWTGPPVPCSLSQDDTCGPTARLGRAATAGPPKRRSSGPFRVRARTDPAAHRSAGPDSRRSPCRPVPPGTGPQPAHPVEDHHAGQRVGLGQRHDERRQFGAAPLAHDWRAERRRAGPFVVDVTGQHDDPVTQIAPAADGPDLAAVHAASARSDQPDSSLSASRSKPWCCAAARAQARVFGLRLSVTFSAISAMVPAVVPAGVPPAGCGGEPDRRTAMGKDG